MTTVRSVPETAPTCPSFKAHSWTSRTGRPHLMSSRSFAVLAATALFITIAGTAPVAAAAGTPGDPIIPTTPSCSIILTAGDPATAPPAPTCYDPSGADLDEFLVPRYVDATGHSVGYEDGNWNPYNWDRPNSTKGASQVTVQSTRYDPAVGFYVNDHAWTLTFNTSVTGAEAGETYRAVVVPGTCNPQTSQWQVEWLAQNLPDATHRYIPSIEGSIYRLADDTPLPPGLIDEHVHAERVYDGHEASLGVESMYPGTYKFAATKGDKTSGWQGWRLEVPTCGRVRGPDADANDTSAVKPRARIALVNRGAVFSKVKVVLGSQKASTPTRYKVIRDPRSGRTLRQSVSTSDKVLRYRVRNGTLVKVVSGKTLLAKRRIG